MPWTITGTQRPERSLCSSVHCAGGSIPSSLARPHHYSRLKKLAVWWLSEHLEYRHFVSYGVRADCPHAVVL